MSDLNPHFALSIIAPTPTTPTFPLAFESFPSLEASCSVRPAGDHQLELEFPSPTTAGFLKKNDDYLPFHGSLQVSYQPLTSPRTYTSSLRSPRRHRNRNYRLTRRSPVQKQEEQMSPHEYGDYMEKGDFALRAEPDEIILDSPIASPLIGMTTYISPPSTPDPGLSTSPRKTLASPMVLAKAVVNRGVRSAKRGNLPFLVIFFSCLFIFLSALAGIGYVPPDSLATAGDLSDGIPVYDEKEARRIMLENHRKLEAQWAAKRRPSDGAWMQRRRDDKAVRRQPAHNLVARKMQEEAQEVSAAEGVAAVNDSVGPGGESAPIEGIGGEETRGA